MKQEELLIIKSHQRAMFAGLIAAILESDEDHSLQEIKLHIARCWSEVIDMGVVVGDDIDTYVSKACLIALEQESALIEAANLTK